MSSFNKIESTGGDPEARVSKPLECTRLCVFCGKLFSHSSALYRHHNSCELNTERSSLEKSKTQILKSSLMCFYCGKTFAYRSGLSRHERFCKKNDFPLYKCPVCFLALSRNDNFKMHVLKCSPGNLHTSKITHRYQCMYENCSAVYFHKMKLTLHLKKFHGSEIDEEKEYHFKNMEEFLKWKHSEEEKTFSCFTKNSGIKGTTIYYHCQHDGSSKPHCKKGALPRKTERKVKRGLVKQGKVCVARITVKVLNDGSCKVVYQPTHSHKLNVKDHCKSPFLTETLKFITHQLAMGVTPKDCFKDLSIGSFGRNSASPLVSIQESEPLFVSKVDLLPLCSRMKIRNNDDSISVLIQTILLSKEDTNPIILYKPVGAGRVIGPKRVDKLPNAKDLFMLGIQTKQQRTMMAWRAKVILSVSSVNGTNAYGYSVLTLVVPDEHNRSYPVAFFISSSIDSDSISCFFEALKSNCPDFDYNIINCIIVPQNLAKVDAIQEGLQLEIPYIWCLRDVHRDLRQNLYNFVPIHLIQDMYSSLCLLIKCKNRLTLDNLIGQFVAKYSVGASAFIKYFNDKYIPKVQLWTMAYRGFLHGNVDTVVLNEAIHNHLRIGSLGEPQYRRLDELIQILLRLDEDNYRKRFTEQKLGVTFGIGNIATCHSEGIRIPDSNIVKVNDFLWEIKTDEDPLLHYEVVKFTDRCINDICSFICNSTECNNLCSHMFVCTCLNTNPLCKHIHKIQEFVGRRQLIVLNNTNDKDRVFLQTGKVEKVVSRNKIKNIRTYTNQLLTFIKNQKVPVQFIEQLETCLDELVMECQNLSSATQKYNTIYKVAYTHTIEDYSLSSSLSTHASTNALHTFTPLFGFAKLSEVILKCDIIDLSFLHLKVLDPFLSVEEKFYMQDAENSCIASLDSTVVNAFCYQLQLRCNKIAALNSDVAFVVARSELSNIFFKQVLLKKNILILPMNLSYNYWTCIAVLFDRDEIIYFSSGQKISEIDKTVIKNMQLIFGKKGSWKVTLAKSNLVKDGISSGIQMCHFAEEIAMEHSLTLLIDVQMYRKHIYETIVQGCLKRNRYSDSFCGKCNKPVCGVVTDDSTQLSICCDKCNQWFHLYCVGLEALDITNMRFICPV